MREFIDVEKVATCDTDIFEWLRRERHFSTTTFKFDTVYVTKDEDFLIAKETIKNAIEKIIFSNEVSEDDEEGNIKIVEDFYKDGKIILVSDSSISVYK